jgi:precorrin-2 dehydrogenase / sirohydrochlorin ferrochelatase
MIPIVLDPERLAFGLVGRGDTAVRRLRWLLDGGAAAATFSDRPCAELEQAAGPLLGRRLPTRDDLTRLDVLWIADLPDEEAASLADVARREGVIVNVEDVREECDFHTPALVRRGDLLLTVSTNGASPGLAARIRRDLAARYDENWCDRLVMLATKRKAWRRRERSLEELARLTDATIDARGWLGAKEEAA